VLELAFRGIERLLVPLDWLRTKWFLLLGAQLAPLHRDRSLRIALVATSSTALALALTLRAPLLLFSLGPLLLGIPHLMADIRYLVLKPQLNKEPRRAIAIAIPLLMVVVFPRPEIGLLAAFLGTLTSPVSNSRKLAVAVPIAVIGGVAHIFPYFTSLAIVHLHNVVAIVFALVLLRPIHNRRWKWIMPIGTYAGGSLALLSGVCDRWLDATMASAGSWMNLSIVTTWYSPSGTAPIIALRVFAWFVFSQSVHYACWLRLIPDALRERATTRSFRASLRDFSRSGVCVLAIAAVLLLVYAVKLGLEPARLRYLKIAIFHSYLEFAVIALWLCDPALRERLRATTTGVPKQGTEAPHQRC
jgi:hypothetical protein